MRTLNFPLLVVLAAAGLSSCSAVERLSEVGEAPPMTKIADPTKAPGYEPVSMPVPDVSHLQPEAGSIWQPGARAFFKDQRAKRVGDVLTVSITINDSASLKNETQGNRGDSDNVTVGSFFGLEKLARHAINTSNPVNTSNTHVTDGKSQIDRAEQVNLRVAGEVSQVLPNGNLVITARQEVRVNYEDRELEVTGIVRPSDIDALDEVTYDKIAEARVSYGGHGQGSSLQQPRYGTQVLDVVSPF